MRPQYSIGSILPFLLLLFVSLSLSNASSHEYDSKEEVVARGVSSQRVKSAQNAKYHLNSIPSARQFCINFLKSNGGVKTVTTTSTALTTSTVTPPASTASTTVFSDITNTVSLTVTSTPSTTITTTLISTVTTHIQSTVTSTITSYTKPFSNRRRNNMSHSPLFSFSHEIIQDACLLYLYGTLTPPAASTATRTSTSTVKTTLATSVITATTTSTRSSSITVTSITAAPTSTLTSTVTGAPSTSTITDPTSTATITQSVPAPEFIISCDQGYFEASAGIKSFQLEPLSQPDLASLFTVQDGQGHYSITNGFLYNEYSENVATVSKNSQVQRDNLVIFNVDRDIINSDTISRVNCQLNLDQSFTCSDVKFGDNTFYICDTNAVYLYPRGQLPAQNTCQLATNVKYTFVQ